jgi:hypothetical protein
MYDLNIVSKSSLHSSGKFTRFILIKSEKIMPVIFQYIFFLSSFLPLSLFIYFCSTFLCLPVFFISSTVILDIVHRLGYLLKSTQRFGDRICLCHQVKTGDRCAVGPLDRASLHHWSWAMLLTQVCQVAMSLSRRDLQLTWPSQFYLQVIWIA